MGKRDEAPDKKVQILNAAAKLLTQSGVQAFSFENVAFEADLSRQLVRYYYSNLDDLITDLCEHLGNVYQNILVTGIAEVKQVGRLKFFLDFFFGVAEGYPMPQALEAYDAMVAYSVGSQKLKNQMCERYYTLGRVVVHELQIAYPELKVAACEEISFMFVSMMHAHWSFVASLGYSYDHSRLARRSIDRLIESYLNDASDVPVIERPWSRGK